ALAAALQVFFVDRAGQLRHRETHDRAHRLDVEADDRFRQLAKFLQPFDAPADGEPARWLALQHLAGTIDATVLHDEGPVRAHLPVRLHAAAEEILPREVAVGERAPHLL